MSKEPWWSSPYRQKHVRLKNEAWVKLTNGKTALLAKGSFISPVRKDLLGKQHVFYEVYDEEVSVAADTPLGFALVPLDALDI